MNIVITGASRGIGFDTATLLASEHTVIACSRNEAGLAALKATNNNIHTYKVDLVACTVAELEAILQPYGHIDVLINNAGLLVNKKFDECTFEEWRGIFETNVLGTVKMIQAAIPLMKGQGIAHIVNIGSMGGVQGTSKFAGLSAYSASKAALANLTECLAEELKNDNIRVNCLALGAVSTEMLKAAFPGYEAPVTSKDMARFIANFSLNSHLVMNGKIVPVSVSTP